MHLTLVSYIRRRSICMFEYIAWQVYSEDTTTPDFGTLVFIHERAATRTNTQTDGHIQKSVAGNVMVTVMSFMYSTTECVVLHVIKLRARLLKKVQSQVGLQPTTGGLWLYSSAGSNDLQYLHIFVYFLTASKSKQKK